MRVIFLYRPKTEQEGRVQDYVRDYKLQHPEFEPELLSVDTREGDDISKLYGIYSYPAILAISRDGSLRQMWQGEQMPLMNEVNAYAFAY